MKIKIIESKNKTKNLKERHELINIENVGSFLDKIQNKIKKNFKKLIFYDLETMGFLPDNYVHQIAALSFSLNFEKTGLSDNVKTTGIVLKSIFDDSVPLLRVLQNKSKEQRDEYVKNTKAIETSKSRASDILKQLMIAKINGLTDLYNVVGDDKIILSSYFVLMNLYKNNSSNEIDKLIKGDEGVLRLHFKQNIENKKITSSFLQLFRKYNTKDGSWSYNGPLYKSQIENLDISNPKNVSRFESHLIKFNKYVKEIIPIVYANIKEDNIAYKKMKSIERLFKRFNISFGMTFLENKYFTHYDSFPAKQFINLYPYQGDIDKQSKTVTKPKSEIENINSFLDFLTNKADDSVLIGHNIGSFDNKVIIVRARDLGIEESKIDKFQDYRFIDTLTVFNFFKKQMLMIREVLKSIGPINTADEVVFTDIMKTWDSGEYAMKVKLEKLMELFESTQDLKQLHTADDDCYQLAKVTIEIINNFTKIINNLQNEISRLNIKYSDDFNNNYDENKKNMKVNSDALITKVNGDLGYYFSGKVFPKQFEQFEDSLRTLFGNWKYESDDFDQTDENQETFEPDQFGHPLNETEEPEPTTQPAQTVDINALISTNTVNPGDKLDDALAKQLQLLNFKFISGKSKNKQSDSFAALEKGKKQQINDIIDKNKKAIKIIKDKEFEDKMKTNPWDAKKKISQKISAARKSFIKNFIIYIISDMVEKDPDIDKNQAKKQRNATEKISLLKRADIISYLADALRDHSVLASLEKSKDDIIKHRQNLNKVIQNIQKIELGRSQASSENVMQPETSNIQTNNPPPLQENKRIIKVRII